MIRGREFHEIFHGFSMTAACVFDKFERSSGGCDKRC